MVAESLPGPVYESGLEMRYAALRVKGETSQRHHVPFQRGSGEFAARPVHLVTVRAKVGSSVHLSFQKGVASLQDAHPPFAWVPKLDAHFLFQRAAESVQHAPAPSETFHFPFLAQAESFQRAHVPLRPKPASFQRDLASGQVAPETFQRAHVSLLAPATYPRTGPWQVEPKAFQRDHAPLQPKPASSRRAHVPF